MNNTFATFKLPTSLSSLECVLIARKGNGHSLGEVDESSGTFLEQSSKSFEQMTVYCSSKFQRGELQTDATHTLIS